jgi:nicotinamidase-related amidase
MTKISGGPLPTTDERAGAEHAPRGELLLVCVDMQPVFIRAVAAGAHVERRCEFALAAAAGLNLPILFTEQAPGRLGGTATNLIARAPTAPVFGKTSFSALADPAISAAITVTHQAEHLLLCGVETSVCVYQTAIAALSAGLQVTILSDAVGARRPEDARVCLDALTRLGAHVLPAETVFYALVHDTAHPFFKAYTQLVKLHG